MQSRSTVSLLKRMLGTASTQDNTVAVTVGDRYEVHSPRNSIWVVERISSVGASHFPLVSLCREGQPDLKKVVSIAVLEEGDEFRPAV